VRAFLQGKLDGLAIGPYFVPHPSTVGREQGAGRSAPAGDPLIRSA
jgi:hypothetical protein